MTNTAGDMHMTFLNHFRVLCTALCLSPFRRRTTDWRWNGWVYPVTSIGVGCSTQRVVAAAERILVSDQYCIGPVYRQDVSLNRADKCWVQESLCTPWEMKSTQWSSKCTYSALIITPGADYRLQSNRLFMKLNPMRNCPCHFDLQQGFY